MTREPQDDIVELYDMLAQHDKSNSLVVLSEGCEAPVVEGPRAE